MTSRESRARYAIGLVTAFAATSFAAACGSRTGLLDDEEVGGLAAIDGSVDATLDATLDGAVDAPQDHAPDVRDVLDAQVVGKCTPKTCAALGYECGNNGDGCGNIIDCGPCAQPEVCGAHDYSKCGKGPPCVPKTCASLGFNCGAAGDGCGGALRCGICQYPDACGGRGEPGHCGNALPCTNLCAQQVACAAGTTTLTGTVVAGTLPQFGAADPIYNALVYVPNAPVIPFATSVSCDQCGAEVSGQPLVGTTTAADGTFTLTNVPVGANIPLVIQLGRWRRIVTIPNVAACATTALPRDLTRMPRNKGEGDIPHIAIATGSVDPIECLLLKMGVDQAEFTQPSGNGRVHLFVSNGANAGAGTPPATQLWDVPSALASYDMVVDPCEAAPRVKTPTQQQNLIGYTTAGGRAFITHYGYTWLYNVGPFDTTASFNPNQNSGANQTTGLVDTSFSSGQALGTWMQAVGALSGPNQFPIREPRHNLNSINAPSERFVTDVSGGSPLQYAFYTPVGAPAAQQCGRIVYSDFHVVPTNNALTTGKPFPTECDSAPLTAQEKNLEFMLFDLASCIPTVPQSCTPRTCAEQGTTCGPAGDGCGTPLDCGPCTLPLTCGGATNFQCGVPDAGACVPKTCAQLGFTCGQNGDGCGGVLTCGTCKLPQVCGGGGAPSRCGGP